MNPLPSSRFPTNIRQGRASRLLSSMLLLTLSRAIPAHAQGPTVYRVSTFAGGAASRSADGDALNLSLKAPTALARDSAGNIYVGDTGNQRIVKITAAGRATVIAGTGVSGYSGDNGPATAAQIKTPRAMALDGDATLYFSESGASHVRKINLVTGVITTAVGDGVNRLAGDGNLGPAASVSEVSGLAVDAQHNLIMADLDNSRVRMLSPATGRVSTIAGTANGSPAEGIAATTAAVLQPSVVAVHPSGDIYLAEYGTGRIRRISNGLITTVVGGSGTALVGPALTVPVGTCNGMAITTLTVSLRNW